MKEKKSYRIAVECLGIAALVIILCSCISFDLADWPSPFAYPHNDPPANLCGSIGAFCAYYLMYHVGPGVFIILVSSIFFLVAKLTHIEVSQPALRTVGILLLTVAASSSFYFFWPYKVYGFPMGSGGMVGVAVTNFLKNHFALFGSFILIMATWIVGAVLLADTLVMSILRWTTAGLGKMFGFAGGAWSAAKQQSEVLGDIWKKLSIKQEPLIKKPSILNFKKDIHIEDSFAESTELTEQKKAKPLKLTTSAKPQKSAKSYRPTSYEDYTLPPLELLDKSEYSFSAVQGKVVKAKAAALEQLLNEFNINAHVVSADTGPVVTMFELELAAGVKVSQISSLANDMARALGVGAVRVVAPLPGRHTIGIEVPNSEKEKVRVRDLIELGGNVPEQMAIPLFLGKDSSGDALISDLAKMPHLLIAGTTGSGKSVCINSIITSILLTRRPDEVKMILVDPKMVEMTAFNTVPHLMCPIVTETQRAVQILEWATVKMDERYALLAEARVKNIAGYNKLGAEEIIERFSPGTTDEEAKIPKRLPYIVVIMDELEVK